MPVVRGCRNRWCPEYAGPDGWCDAHRKPPFWSSPPLPPGWPRIRAAQLAAFPWCAQCGAKATDVHHVRGRAAGDGPDNLAVALRPVPPPHHRDRGRVAVGAVIASDRLAARLRIVRGDKSPLATHSENGKPGSELVALGDTRCKPRRLGVPATPRSRRGGPRSPLCAARRAEAGCTGARVGRAAQTRQRRSQDPALRPRRGGAAGRRAAAGRAGAVSLAAVAATGPGGGCRAASDPEPGGLDRAGRVRGPGSARPGRAGLLACPLADRRGRGLSHVSEVGWPRPGAGVQGRMPGSWVRVRMAEGRKPGSP